MKDLSSIEAADRKRDARLRRRLLHVLHEARISPLGGMGGRRLVDLIGDVQPHGQSFTGDDHALGLLRDLTHAGLVKETDLRKRRGQMFGLDYLFYGITVNGTALLNEQIPPNPMVDDERNLES